MTPVLKVLQMLVPNLLFYRYAICESFKVEKFNISVKKEIGEIFFPGSLRHRRRSRVQNESIPIPNGQDFLSHNESFEI